MGKQRLVTRVILENPKGKILFLKRASKIGFGLWNLPGGKVEFGQSLEDACREELKQETNLDIFEPDFLFYGEDLPGTIDQNHWFAFYFKAGFYLGDLRLNEESSDFRWIGPEDLRSYPCAFGHEVIADRYFANKRC